MLQLNFQSYPIQLQYNIQNAKLNMKTTLPKVDIETTPPQMEIRQPRGELEVDWTDYYHSIGLKTFTALSQENASKGRQAVLDAIAETVAKGDRLAQITNPNNAIAELAVQSQISEKGELNWNPIVAPTIRYEASPAEIKVIRGTINYDPHNATIDSEYHPGEVDISVTQYPRLDISVVDVKV